MTDAFIGSGGGGWCSGDSHHSEGGQPRPGSVMSQLAEDLQRLPLLSEESPPHQYHHHHQVTSTVRVGKMPPPQHAAEISPSESVEFNYPAKRQCRSSSAHEYVHWPIPLRPCSALAEGHGLTTLSAATVSDTPNLSQTLPPAKDSEDKVVSTFYRLFCPIHGCDSAVGMGVHDGSMPTEENEMKKYNNEEKLTTTPEVTSSDSLVFTFHGESSSASSVVRLGNNNASLPKCFRQRLLGSAGPSAFSPTSLSPPLTTFSSDYCASPEEPLSVVGGVSGGDIGDSQTAFSFVTRPGSSSQSSGFCDSMLSPVLYHNFNHCQVEEDDQHARCSSIDLINSSFSNIHNYGRCRSQPTTASAGNHHHSSSSARCICWLRRDEIDKVYKDSFRQLSINRNSSFLKRKYNEQGSTTSNTAVEKAHRSTRCFSNTRRYLISLPRIVSSPINIGATNHMYPTDSPMQLECVSAIKGTTHATTSAATAGMPSTTVTTAGDSVDNPLYCGRGSEASTLTESSSRGVTPIHFNHLHSSSNFRKTVLTCHTANANNTNANGLGEDESIAMNCNDSSSSSICNQDCLFQPISMQDSPASTYSSSCSSSSSLCGEIQKSQAHIQVNGREECGAIDYGNHDWYVEYNELQELDLEMIEKDFNNCDNFSL